MSRCLISVCAAVVTASCSPIEILSGYGSTTAVSKDEHGNHHTRGRPHDGVDLRASVGRSVIASAPGVIFRIHFDRDYGYDVWILHDQTTLDEKSKGAHYVTSYAHLKDVTVRPASRVTRGATLGHVGLFWGSAGVSHLHWRLCRGSCREGLTMDPLPATAGCFGGNNYDDRRLILTYPLDC